VAKSLSGLGFTILATRGTAAEISAAGVEVKVVNKVTEGRPHVVDMLKNGEICMIINTVDSKRSSIQDSYSIRHAALQGRITYYTTMSGARAACVGMQHLTGLEVYDLQALHKRLLNQKN
jgi:carbamoyl-phosphate synthase large subunit